MVPVSRKESITIEIAFVLPRQQFIRRFQVPMGTSINQAITLSGVASFYPKNDNTLFKIGIYGRVVSLTRILQEDDRIEIYRPLIIDPKEKRKLKVRSTYKEVKQ